ncbi:MAG: Hpt domain-containing protein [Gammaproteobacteria bacterium]
MISPKAMDSNTLNWVKPEIDGSLKQARHALEAFAGNPLEIAQMRICANLLQQVRGTLQMIELHGPAQLAEEMELVAQVLLSETDKQQDDTYELLMRAILQLPDHLEHLQMGRPENSHALVSLVNEMRAVRGQKLIAESKLFEPDLSIFKPVTTDSHVPTAPSFSIDIRVAARKLRPTFQLALVNWHRNPQDLGHVGQLLKVVRRLEEISHSKAMIQLWWITGGLLEAIVDDGLPPNFPVSLLGQVDRQIKRLIDLGEDEWSLEQPAALVKDLLYQVAQTQSASEHVAEIKQAFNLAELICDAGAASASSESLGAPNRELMRTVGAVIKEDLAKVKDGLDIFVRGEQSSVSAMEPLEAILRQTADTLSMLGMDAVRNLVLEQAASLKSMQQENRVPSEASLVELAGTLLYVEAALDDLGTAVAISADSGEHDDGAKVTQGAEYRQVINAVIKEAKVDLSRVKDALINFITQPGHHELLVDVPQQIAQVIGSLTMLSEKRAASLLGNCKNYIAEHLLAQRINPDYRQLESLADVIVGIEYYLEALDENRSDRESILDIAQQGIAGFDPSDVSLIDESPAQSEPAALIDTPMPQSEAASWDEPVEHYSTDDATTDFNASIVEVTEHELRVEEDEAPLITLSESIGLLPEAESITEVTAPATPAIFSRPEGIDDEIVEIFIEEAQEELASIAINLPIWKLHPFTSDAMTLVRRSFHTLKGSGRMVGATTIGEFAWAVEGMLNRVIDGTVAVNAELFSLIERAQQILPELIEAFSASKTVTVDVQGLIDQANRLSQPDPARLPVEAAKNNAEVSKSVAETSYIDEITSPPVNTDEQPYLSTVEPPEFANLSATDWPNSSELDFTAEYAESLSAEEPASFTAEPMTSFVESVIADELTDIVEFKIDTVPESGAETNDLEDYPTDVESQIDPVLLEIFSREAATHLAVMQTFVDFCQQEPDDCRTTEKLLRTLHTLHGSAAMAGIADIAVVSDVLEEYAKYLNLHQAVLSPVVVAMLSDSIDLIRKMVAALQDPRSAKPDPGAFLNTLSDLRMAPLVVAPAAEVDEPVIIEQPEAELHITNVPIVQQDEPATAKVDDDQQEIDNEIVEIFLEEAREIIEAIEVALQQWIVDQNNRKWLEELQRQLHTLKGGARMSGLSAIGDLSHTLESVITAVMDEQIPLSPQLPKLMQQTQDRLVQMLDSAAINLPLIHATELISHLEEISGGSIPDETLADEIQADDLSAQQSYAPIALIQPKPELPRNVKTAAASKEDLEEALDENRVALRPQHEQVRVRADLLDNLVNFAAEISISRSRIEQQMGAFKYNLIEVDQIISRLRGQLRNLEIETEAQIVSRYAEAAIREEEEFDPLEFDRFSQMQQLSRSLLESVSDLANIEGLLNGLTRESETLLVQQARVNTDLHEGLMRARMVQFAVLMPRLRRIVRQTCQQLGKEVELRVIGADGEMDRTVLDRIVPSLEHMLRNSIDHGIESAEVRRAAGKEENGQITLRLQRESSAMTIELSDNGRGLNLSAIREKAIKRGLLSADDDASAGEVMQFILEPGFTTAQEVTQISGRGVGLDVVNSEIKQLNGTLDIASESGQGTTFTVRLPLTLSISRALLVHLGEELYAIPLTSIERVAQLSYEELMELYGLETPIYSINGQDYQLAHLSTVLSGERHAVSGPKRKHPVLLARAGDHRVALEVDSLLGSREIVVKSVGPQISTIRGITGATILGDGRVVLILDINSVMRAGAAAKAVKDLQHMLVCAVPERSQITAMVVDDSITVRKVTTRLLERHNIQVLTAKDGVDAVTLLHDHIPDVMLLDVEMPRMDGYELATHMRNEERLRNIPIIMITSRTGQKHRDRAMQIGVNVYMGKPYQESELMENIGNLLGDKLEVHH